MSFLDLVFPKKCVGCGRVGGYVCEKCEVGMWEEEQICPVCRRLSRYGLRHKYCNKPGTMEGLTCLWAYDGLAKKLIQNAKYRYYYDYLGEMLREVTVRVRVRTELTYFWEFLETKPVIVPVPLHPNRERQRGFNQAEIITGIVGRQWGLGTRNLLVRVKDTGQQVGRSKNERLEEMKNAFQIDSRFRIYDLRIKSVLLVDDVWTTGATMNECAKVLRKAGVERVWGLVLAR